MIYSKIWQVKQLDKSLGKSLAQKTGLPYLIAQLLANRGLSTAEEVERFLSTDIRDLHDPHLLKDLAKAVKRIKRAIKCGERIMIWGDYDVDGLTAAGLLFLVLKDMRANVDYYIPDRLNEGYGLNRRGIDIVKKKNTRLLITVDCGITAFAEIKYLNRLGIEVIVTDHHLPKSKRLPKAYAVIDPLQHNCPYPFKYLSGVGLAYKLATALLKESSKNIHEHLDIVALGTVADIVPVTGENRILIKNGLARLKHTKKVGLKTLIAAVGLSAKNISTGHIGFILGPRLNAGGRLGKPHNALKLLLSEKLEEAQVLAKILNEANRERQRIESQTLKEALLKIEREINFKHHRVIVLGKKDWHPGVIGIVASRIVERFYRPAIVVSFQKDMARGSGRSIRGFHLLEAVNKCQQFLEEFGGHRMACGFSIKKEKFTYFLEDINRIARDVLLPEDLVASIDIDMEIKLKSLSLNIVKKLDELSPFGVDNPQPLFCSRNLRLKNNPEIVGRNHLKMWVSDGTVTTCAIGYKMAEFLPLLKKDTRIDLAYRPLVDSWQGTNSLQLKVEDIRIL